MKAPAHLKEDDIDFSNVRTVFDRNKLKVRENPEKASSANNSKAKFFKTSISLK